MSADELLRHLVDALESLEIPYALTGSIASLAYGEPRATLDIDVVADLQVEALPGLKERFPSSEFYLDIEAARDAVRTRGQFNIIHPRSGFKADLFIPGDEIQRRQIARCRRLPVLADVTASFTPPEELIIKKMEYYAAGGSDKHLRDIAAMLRISGNEIDREMIAKLATSVGLGDLWETTLQSIRTLDKS